MRDSVKKQRPLSSVPVKQSDRAVAASIDMAKLEPELDHLVRLVRPGGDKQQLAKLRKALSALWEAADQPATADETAMQLMLLSAAFPNTARAELDLFAQVVADDVATLKPTNYELAHACRAVRTEHEFLSEKAVIDAIKKARRAGRRARWLVTESFYRSARGWKVEDDYFHWLEILSGKAEPNREVFRQEVVERTTTTNADSDV
jgi:hypothetical protein